MAIKNGPEIEIVFAAIIIDICSPYEEGITILASSSFLFILFDFSCYRRAKIMKFKGLLLGLLFPLLLDAQMVTPAPWERSIDSLRSVVANQKAEINRVYEMYSDQNNGFLGAVGGVVGGIAALIIVVGIIIGKGLKDELKALHIMNQEKFKEETQRVVNEGEKKIRERAESLALFESSANSRIEALKTATQESIDSLNSNYLEEAVKIIRFTEAKAGEEIFYRLKDVDNIDVYVRRLANAALSNNFKTRADQIEYAIERVEYYIRFLRDEYGDHHGYRINEMTGIIDILRKEKNLNIPT